MSGGGGWRGCGWREEEEEERSAAGGGSKGWDWVIEKGAGEDVEGPL